MSFVDGSLNLKDDHKDQEKNAHKSSHERLAGLVYDWRQWRERLKDNEMTDLELSICIQNNIDILYQMKSILNSYPHAAQDMRMMLSNHELQKNWEELCDARYELVTTQIISKAKSIQILIDDYQHRVRTEAKETYVSDLKTKTLDKVISLLKESFDVAASTAAMGEQTNIHLMIYLDNISYLKTPKKLDHLLQTFGKGIEFRNDILQQMNLGIDGKEVTKKHDCLRGVLAIRRMVDDEFSFNYINKTRAVYEQSLKDIKQGDVVLFSPSFYRALQMTQAQMYYLVEDLYSWFFRLPFWKNERKTPQNLGNSDKNKPKGP